MSIEVKIKLQYPGFYLDVAFAAEDEVLGFLGTSGCGKSLTLRAIAGLVTPDEGYIVVNGQVFFDSAKRINLKPQQRKTALLFQDYKLFPNLTVADNIAAGMSRDYGKEEIHRRVKDQLLRFNLKGYGSRYPAQLSGGQQQRVALARMLAAEPGILMLDEPFSALDSHLKGILEQELIHLFDTFESSILYVSHDIDEALHFCDRIAIVDNGRIVEESISDELVHHPQSLAALKLSGVKNITTVQRLDAHTVRCPKWGIDIATSQEVPADVKHLGVRAFFLEQADGSGENVFRCRVSQVSDSRFERTLLLRVMSRAAFAEPEVEINADDIKYLEQQIFWRVDKLSATPERLPKQGDEVFIRIPPDKVHLTSK